jgi:hypothetical protein
MTLKKDKDWKGRTVELITNEAQAIGEYRTSPSSYIGCRMLERLTQCFDRHESIE